MCTILEQDNEKLKQTVRAPTKAVKLLSLKHCSGQTKYFCNSNASSWLPVCEPFKKWAHAEVGKIKPQCMTEV